MFYGLWVNGVFSSVLPWNEDNEPPEVFDFQLGIIDSRDDYYIEQVQVEVRDMYGALIEH
jgi:hypothetical protein